MIGLVVRQMNLEERQPIVDGVDEADLTRQQVDGTDAAVGQAADAVGQFIADVTGGEDRLGTITELGLVESAVDLTLASRQALT